jgi:hypothetical protein
MTENLFNIQAQGIMQNGYEQNPLNPYYMAKHLQYQQGSSSQNYVLNPIMGQMQNNHATETMLLHNRKNAVA